MNTTLQGSVEYHVTNHIATVCFFHPQSNSLPAYLLDKLAQTFHALGNDDECHVIILKSEGEKAFCAGASFDELLAIQTESEGLQFFSGFAHVINAMRKCNKLIIGRIQGKCVGGGVGLAAACDYAIAHQSADVKLSELAVGIGPFVVGPAVERKMGTSAYSQLAIDATKWRNAEWAKHKGLFAEVYDHIEAVDEAVLHLATTLAHSSPAAMADMKAVFWQGTENWDILLRERAAISGKLVLSNFTRKAIAAFKSTRK